jgi:hypothetical protein
MKIKSEGSNLLVLNVINKNQVRILLSILLLEYSVFIISGTSYSFLTDAVLKTPGFDFVYWIINLTKIPSLIISNKIIAIFLDFITVFILLYSIIKPNSLFFFRLLFLLFLLFYISFNTFHTHHNIQIGFAIVLLPFIFKKVTNFLIAWDFLRYYLLFFYFSAGFYKIIWGGCLDIGLMAYLLKNQHSIYFYFTSDGLRQKIINYFLQHVYLSWILYLMATALELFSAVGFFSKKYDKTIFIFLVFFQLANWYFMDIGIFGQLAFLSILVIKPINYQLNNFTSAVY